MKMLNNNDFMLLNVNVSLITSKTIPDYTVVLFDTPIEFVKNTYGILEYVTEISYIPDYMRVKIDFEKNIIYTCDESNISLYIFYLVNEIFNAGHNEWLYMLECWARLDFCSAEDIEAAEDIDFPRILYIHDKRYDTAKARLFAEMTEKYGFDKMLEWNETVDLLFYYQNVFGEDYPKYIDKYDISYYETVLRGEEEADKHTHLSLWINGEYRSESRLDVFYADGTLTKAAIKYKGYVLGFADITPSGICSYVADYKAWSRRRAAGYARNNPYNEQDFMKKVLSYAPPKNPVILEIGVGSGRIAKPFVEAGYEYHGIDILDTMLDECRATLSGYENLHLYNHNILNGLPFADNTFDIIIESRVISNIYDKPPIMEEIERVIKPGGSAILGISDNYTTCDDDTMEYLRQSQLFWSVYKDAYYNRYNISDKRSHPQNYYSLSLPEDNITSVVRESTYIIPPPAEIYAYDQGAKFSECKFDFNFIDHCCDNIYHMAYFRFEPLYEPCGTEFFKVMMDTAEKAFGRESVKQKRFTECRIYKY